MVTLERNYRSTAPLLDAANVARGADAARAFPQAPARTTATATSARSCARATTRRAQADAVCDRVLEAREQGVELRAQAVLMRTSHDSDLLELELHAPRASRS